MVKVITNIPEDIPTFKSPQHVLEYLNSIKGSSMTHAGWTEVLFNCIHALAKFQVQENLIEPPQEDD